MGWDGMQAIFLNLFYFTNSYGSYSDKIETSPKLYNNLYINFSPNVLKVNLDVQLLKPAGVFFLLGTLVIILKEFV